MSNRKILKQRIITFSIIIALCGGYAFLKNSNIFNKGYNTVEEAVIHEKSVSKNNLAIVLGSNNLYLVFYDKGSRKIAIVYSNKGKYYIDNTNPTDIFFKTIDGFSISVQKNLGKVIIIIMNFGSDIPKSFITDSLKSTFSYGQAEFAGERGEYWFLTLDKIPQFYSISINEKIIEVKGN
jgi:hypothetical protein